MGKSVDYTNLARRLWRGGEHLKVFELVNTGKLKQDDIDALLPEMPQLRTMIEKARG